MWVGRLQKLALSIVSIYRNASELHTLFLENKMLIRWGTRWGRIAVSTVANLLSDENPFSHLPLFCEQKCFSWRLPFCKNPHHKRQLLNVIYRQIHIFTPTKERSFWKWANLGLSSFKIFPWLCLEKAHGTIFTGIAHMGVIKVACWNTAPESIIILVFWVSSHTSLALLFDYDLIKMIY